MVNLTPAQKRLLTLLTSGGWASQEAGDGPRVIASDNHVYAARTAHALRRAGLVQLSWCDAGIASRGWFWILTPKGRDIMQA